MILVSSCQSRSSVCTCGDIQLQQLQYLCSYLVIFLLLKSTDTSLELSVEIVTLLYEWDVSHDDCFYFPVLRHRIGNAIATETWDLEMLYSAEKHRTLLTVVPYNLII